MPFPFAKRLARFSLSRSLPFPLALSEVTDDVAFLRSLANAFVVGHNHQRFPATQAPLRLFTEHAGMV